MPIHAKQRASYVRSDMKTPVIALIQYCIHPHSQCSTPHKGNTRHKYWKEIIVFLCVCGIISLIKRIIGI